jgi:hypothetical protein
MSIIPIPKLPDDQSVWEGFPVVGKPGWFASREFRTGKTLKPLIRCNCGHVSGIGLHHVHPDGTVTASYYHKKGTVYPEDSDGCEWHVFLKLEGWTGEDIPPDPK